MHLSPVDLLGKFIVVKVLILEVDFDEKARSTVNVLISDSIHLTIFFLSAIFSSAPVIGFGRIFRLTDFVCMSDVDVLLLL